MKGKLICYGSFRNGLSACRLALQKITLHLPPMRMIFAIILSLTPILMGSIVPKPRQQAMTKGHLTVDARTRVIAPAELEPQAKILITALQKTTGVDHQFRTIERAARMKIKQAIRLELINSTKSEFYRIQISPSGARIYGSDLAGLSHGIQTFAQLLPVAKESFPRALIPSQLIEDWPENKRRIFHLDVSAHLFPTNDLKSLVDWLSFHRLNELHLQLNGDHGWRMESLKFPKLHEIGSVRDSTPPFGDPTGSDSTEYGGYYPQTKLKELVAHAKSRGITIVPTFTLTQGAAALITAYPQLGAKPTTVANTWKERNIGVLENVSTLEFFDTFFAEVAAIFPAQEIRLQGGDGKFHAALRKVLTKHRRTLLLSDRIKTTDLSTYPRPKEAELLIAAKLEAEEGFNPVSKVYQWQPGPISQASLRTRHVPDFDKLNYLVFPRIAAFAEVTWLPQSQLNYDDFRTRLEALDQRYRLSRVTASLPYDAPSEEALHGTIVTSSIAERPNYSPTLVFDGKLDSFFWSANGLKEGDHLTLEFPWPVTGTATATTGKGGLLEGIMEAGALEISVDGKDWKSSKKLFQGSATIQLLPKTRFLRIRATEAQETSLVFGEIIITPILLAPLHEESREVILPFNRKKINLTFKADFQKNPELRAQIEVARETFFKNWRPLAERIGTAHYLDTPRLFEIKAGELGALSKEQTRIWVLKRMISEIQRYPVTAPLWFTTGTAARLLGDFPAAPTKAKFKEGGPETAAFLQWVAKEYGEEVLVAMSQECRNANYREETWKFFTKKSLNELATLYKNAE